MEVNNNEIRNSFFNYLDLYGENYPEDTLEYIKYNFEHDINFEEVSSVMYQIYTKLGLVSKYSNRYFGFMEELINHFNIDQNIVEVAGGYFPIFAEELGKLQRSGSITVYDPNLVVNNLGRLVLKKETFHLGTNIDNCNLIVGISPCESTGTIIKKANSEHKEFFIAMCGCDHSPSSIYRPSYYNWESYIYDLIDASIDENASIETVYINERYEYPYPILMKKYNHK